ncbi:hypothetical protein [Nocardia sp. NPDC050710]|uniref:hypothetical protein n=1 Tax=Nocardia sp. NPDC050710 TaxID=3157220 RepID=UPI0034092A8A
MTADRLPDTGFDRVDMDPAAEVIAVADRHSGAITTIIDQVSAVVGELTPSCRPESDLDRALNGWCGWIVDEFGAVLSPSRELSEVTRAHAAVAANALDTTDIAGGASVRGARPI